ncbi:MAG: glycosyl hydrolase [Gorillibacterium sp.]|nr:glycosyl hydrolase [Gorillibacterium sp.]
MKRFYKILLCLTILLGVTTVLQDNTTQAAASGVNIMLDGYPLSFPIEPVIISGTTMVPFRAIAEALGIQVEWNQAAKEVTASKKDAAGTTVVKLTIGSKNAVVNANTKKLIIAPLSISGTTMIPLSFFSTQFGATVSWNQTTKTVSIISPKKDMYTLGFYAVSAFDQYALLPDFDAIAFGWSRIDRSGEFTLQGEGYNWPQPADEITPELIVSDLAAKGTSPYLMVYSVDGKLELTKNLEDLELQARTISGIINAATQKGFEGIMLDLEGLGLSGDKAKARSDYNGFVQNLSAKAGQAGLKLSIVLHPLNSSYTGYDYKTLANLADDLIIMAYAYGDEKSPEPVDKVDEAIRLALQQTSKDKLILGISLASENETSVNTKIGLAKRYDLKGVAIWRLGIIAQPVWTEMNKSVEL